ncbi:MAG: sigma-70 family RNA polymerase sigma factor [Planctomycetes bacterium]|nr:sigma-70 family RNA polymerase sigma factor [Planctomycetota bacterium]
MATANLTATNDGELLTAFVEDRRHEAFAEIVRRHGPLVLGTCRSVLGNSSDAEDAAQAVFLALFHKASSLRRHPTLAGWLHRVAWYAASCEKRSITVRTRHEQEAAAMKWKTAQMQGESVPSDMLHAGLAKLPDKYRLPIILHHLEGYSQDQIAQMLGKKRGTIMSRLNYGRQLLRTHLAKTGAAVSVAALTTAMASQATASVSSAFVASVTKMAALTFTSKAIATGAASAKVLALSKGALNMLFIAKVKVAAMLTAVICLVGAMAAGTYMAAAAGPGGRPVRPPATSTAPPKAAPPKVETIAPANPSTPPASSNDKVTVVEITDKILVKDTCRLGINLGGDSVFNGAVLVKKRVQENFEGTLYRQCHFSPQTDANGVLSWSQVTEDWKKVLLEGTYTILSGPNKQTSGKIKSIGSKDRQGRQLAYFELDKPITAEQNARIGLLVENLERIREGQFRPLGSSSTTKDNQIVIGDTPPESFGCAALCLKSASGPASVMYRISAQRFADNNGTWHVELWAKAKEGNPKLTVEFVEGQNILASQPVELTNQWKKYQLTLKVEGFTEPKDAQDAAGAMGQIVLKSDGGQVLVDDIEAWNESDKNPTAFRDDCVEAVKLYNPSVLRFLQIGGNSVENTLMPPIKAYAYSSSLSDTIGPYNMRLSSTFGAYSLHEMYQLCEYLGVEPWYCLPGTMHMDEMKSFMEYLGGPADSKYGKLRADMGHPKPWTETLRQIHVEFGNEAWNSAAHYKCGGFNGPDYWKDLISLGKTSPYYKSNVIFHAGSHANNIGVTEQICADVPNADRISIAPYMAQFLEKADVEKLDSDDKLFRWVFSWALQRTLKEDSSLNRTYAATRKAGIELSFYEVNYGASGDGPPEPRNTIITSLAGGVNLANTLLLMLKRQGTRIQNVFVLAQYDSKMPNGGRARLSGVALTMRKGKERYRPTFLGCALANKVLGGNLVETVHSGANPTFQGAAGRSEDRKTSLENFSADCIWSYAFSDGKKRGLILVNLDLKDSRPVEVRFQGKPKGPVKCWTMAGDKPSASNELENDKPQVEIVESQLQLENGGKLTLPPCSMQAYAWEVE